jgi:tRNA(adenine34) deaminase
MTREEFFMNEALIEARKASKKLEVPVGAVIVRNNKIIAKSHNLRESTKSPLGHSEILAIEKASAYLKGWRLTQCEIYVTLEPCLMCAGAIYQARIDHLFYGTKDEKSGAVESVFRVLDEPRLNHIVNIQSGILASDCKSILSEFFQNLRVRKKDRKSI